MRKRIGMRLTVIEILMASQLSAREKMETFLGSSKALLDIPLPDEMREYYELLNSHIAYSAILTKKSIFGIDLPRVEAEIFGVRRRGLELYPEASRQEEAEQETHRKTWVTINSHYMTHFPEYIRRFGVPRNTWVFAFENFLKGLRRYYVRHMSGKSDGMIYLTYFI